MSQKHADQPAASPARPAEPAIAHRWKALGVLAGGLALIVLDGTIVGIALPAIISDLGLHIADAVWVNSLYSMIFAALLLTSGWLADRIGRRRQFLLGVAVFVAGSVLAGVAGGAAALIAARAVQGVGGALIMPTTVSTVNVLFRGPERAHAFGIWGAVMAASAAIGPLAGAALTQYVDWRWVFFVNVPLGVLLLVLASRWVPENRGEAGRGFDTAGLLLSAGALGLLVFGLVEGADLGWWTPRGPFSVAGLRWPDGAPLSAAAAALIVGSLLLLAFLAAEASRRRAGRSVILDLGLFGIPAFAWGNLAATMVAAGEFALVFVLPLFLINVAGLDLMAAGWVLAAMALGAFVSGALARHVAARFGAATVVVIGLALEALGVVGTVLALGPATPAPLIAATLAVYGLGLGLASAQLTSTVMGGVPPAQSGVASATQSTVRQVGSALGSALAGTMLESGLAHRLPARLGEVPGLPGPLATQVTDGTIASVGGLIPMIRSGLGQTNLGDFRAPVGDALARAFADATGWALWLALGFLVLGLAAALVVRRHAATDAVGPKASGSHRD